jgi:hypothetical protein
MVVLQRGRPISGLQGPIGAIKATCRACCRVDQDAQQGFASSRASLQTLKRRAAPS